MDQLKVHGREVVNDRRGIWSGIQVGGKWYTTENLSHSPEVSQVGKQLRVTGIAYGSAGMRVEENWTLIAKKDSIDWKIERRYLDAGNIDGTAMPLVSFKDMSTWTGAVLGSGGVAWCKLLDSPNATYGVQTDSATFWNLQSDPSLSIYATKKSGVAAMRFTREPGEGFSVASCITKERLQPRSHQTRFQKTRQDLWAPFKVAASDKVTATIEFKPLSYGAISTRGDFKGLDTKAITEMVNTIGRIGVIDEGLVGTNGWYSGYICLHEPWQARVGTAINDPNYTRSESEFLDYAQAHAILSDGMVKSRWYYNAGDAQPGTYDEKYGFYEAQWGRLMDSQSSYVWNVSDQFDQTGDQAWVAKHKGSCEAALDYLLRRDSNGNGLVEMDNKSLKEKRSSDWLDIVWASHENAFVNAQLYGALVRWASVEQILGDEARASHYRRFAAKLKTSFNKTIADGGFWDPAKGWYVYWRDADGSVHGNNLTVEVNLTALADGICDDPERRQILLNEIEARMKAESLLSWPACFESFAPGEGSDDHFPTYENGDIFLSWAEYGIKAYASSDPATALKYIKRLLDQYNKDGLAFQRYLRADGKGAGDDILAGNCNVITGLYRDIYGINPKYNRLYLEPHLLSELNGTKVNYSFRGKALQIGLSVNDYSVSSANRIIKSPTAFGVSFSLQGFTYFAASSDQPTLTVKSSSQSPLVACFSDWGLQKSWTIASDQATSITQQVHGLTSDAQYRVVSDGKVLGTVSQSHDSLTVRCDAGKTIEFQLIPVSRS